MWNGDVTGMGKKLKGNACSAFVIIQLKKIHCISSHRGQHEKNQNLSDFPTFRKSFGETCRNHKIPLFKKILKCKEFSQQKSFLSPAFTYILICLLSYPPKKVYLKKVFLNALVQCTKNILSISRYVSVCLLPSHLDLAELDGEGFELCPFFYVYVLALKKCSASSTHYSKSLQIVKKYLYIRG